MVVCCNNALLQIISIETEGTGGLLVRLVTSNLSSQDVVAIAPRPRKRANDNLYSFISNVLLNNNESYSCLFSLLECEMETAHKRSGTWERAEVITWGKGTASVVYIISMIACEGVEVLC